MRRPRIKRSRPRAGFSLLEMLVAVIVFGTVLTTFLPMMRSVREQQRGTDQHLLALREADNLLEIISTRDWNELTNEELGKLTLPEDVASRLPNGTLKIEVSESTEQAASKRVAVTVSWTSKLTQPARTVRLAAWFPRTQLSEKEARP